MLPTLPLSSLRPLFVDRVSVRLQRLRPGDIVACDSPVERGKQIMKRLAALPGEKVQLDDTDPASPIITVPKGHVWLESDNRSAGIDSRHYGPVPMSLVRGRLMLWTEPETFADRYRPDRYAQRQAYLAQLEERTRQQQQAHSNP